MTSVPLELVATAPRTAVVREYEERPLRDDQVRVESEFSAFKHGTGLRTYRADSRDHTAAFDWDARLHRTDESRTPSYPIPLGNVTVGTVTDVGDGVDGFEPGNRVYGYHPIRETHVVSGDDLWHAPEGMAVEAIAYADPGRVGLHLVRTAGVKLGDAVAVFGAGAIGQMTAQLARLQGADRVVVSEPIDRRREAARAQGADHAIDPTDVDAAEWIKSEVAAGSEPGVDVALETSGAYPGLEDAIRSAAFGGVVASCGYYAGDSSPLHLAGEWHRNRLELRTVRPPSEPHRDDPRWDLDRVNETAFDLLRGGRLSAEGLIDPIVPIDRADEGIRLIDEHPEESIKLGVVYDS